MDFLVAARGQSHIVAEMAGLRVLVPTADRTIARSVYTSGDWDPLLVGTAFDALKRSGICNEGTVFLEVGANFGVYSLPAVSQFGFARAVAYEPDPARSRSSSRTSSATAWGIRVSAHHAALSASPAS